MKTAFTVPKARNTNTPDIKVMTPIATEILSPGVTGVKFGVIIIVYFFVCDYFVSLVIVGFWMRFSSGCLFYLIREVISDRQYVE